MSSSRIFGNDHYQIFTVFTHSFVVVMDDFSTKKKSKDLFTQAKLSSS
jgi:hypothetical protein